MRELDLGGELFTLDGEPYQTLEGVLPVLLTVGRASLRQIGMATSAEKELQFTTFELGLKIRKRMKEQRQGSILLETAEYDHLKTIVETNPAQYVDVIQAQLRRAIQDAPEVEVEKKSEE